MRATEFEFRNRFWVIGVIFMIGFLLYNLDHRNAAQRLIDWIAPKLNGDDVKERHALTCIFLSGTGLAVLAAMLRTWATAYLKNEVVHDARLHADQLMVDGPYRRVRNPLYLGLLLLSFAGAPMASGIGAAWIIAAITMFALRLIGREEMELSAQLGKPYHRYRAAVPRLLPALWPRVPAAGSSPQWGRALVGEAFFWIFAAAIATFALTLDLRIAGAACFAAVAFYLLVHLTVLRVKKPA